MDQQQQYQYHQGPPNSFEEYSLHNFLRSSTSPSSYNLKSSPSIKLASVMIFNPLVERDSPIPLKRFSIGREDSISLSPTRLLSNGTLDMRGRKDELEGLIFVSPDCETRLVLSEIPDEMDQINLYSKFEKENIETKSFILKLMFLLDNTHWYGDSLCWNEAGTHFAVRTDSKQLVQSILPLFYSHGQIASLQRQLNAYEFKRLPNIYQKTLFQKDPFPNSTFTVYSHSIFHRNDLKKAAQLRPKISKARQMEAKTRVAQGVKSKIKN